MGGRCGKSAETTATKREPGVNPGQARCCISCPRGGIDVARVAHCGVKWSLGPDRVLGRLQPSWMSQKTCLFCYVTLIGGDRHSVKAFADSEPWIYTRPHHCTPPPASRHLETRTGRDATRCLYI